MGCYTEALYDALMSRWTEEDDAPVVVLGLGGGILPARLARRGIRTHVLEIDRTIVATYYATFAPQTIAWSPSVSTHVSVHLQDALTASYADVRWVVVDIPSCYRDVSDECFRLLHRIADTGARLVVNVWAMHMPAFLAGAPPGECVEFRQGVCAYVVS